MIALSPTTRIFVYTGPTDMRKGFCGLSGLVKGHFQVDLFTGHLFDIGDQASEEDDDDDPEPTKPTKRRRRKKKSEKLPAHLRREIIEADVSRKDRMCSCCGEEMPIIGTDISERLDLIPAELFVWEIRRHKRACGKCKESIAQVPAGEEPGGLTTPVPGSDYGFGVYNQIITNKFGDHLPRVVTRTHAASLSKRSRTIRLPMRT